MLNMKLKYQICFRLTLFVIVCTSKLLAQTPCKEIVGYYPNWQWYDRNKLVNPQSIDYSKYTILNYAFFKPEADGSISILDPWADKNILLGPINWAVAPAGYDSAYDFGNPAYHQPGQQFSQICHQHNVKLLPSIGGWTLSENLPGIAADPAKRANFAQSCVELIQAFNFDGIDLDWEYPGYAEHGGTPQDITNFTLLLQEIRTAIDNYGVSVNKSMLLTIAVGASQDRMDDVEWQEVSQTVDIINLMSYDFFGAWDANTNHNSPLYATAAGDPTFNIDAAVDKLVNDYQVSPQKITVGVAFYGRTTKTTGPAGLHVPTTGAVDAITFVTDEGSPLYYNVLLQQQLFTENWDALAKVPYLTGNNGLQTFVSYDNQHSVGQKAEYIVENQLRGAIIWEITGDYIETAPGSGIIASTPLVDTLNNVFCNYTPSDLGNPTIDGGMTDFITVYPNPVADNLHIHLVNGSANQILLVDLTGKTVFSTIPNDLMDQIIDVHSLPNGTYVLKIVTDQQTIHQSIIINHLV